MAAHSGSWKLLLSFLFRDVLELKASHELAEVIFQESRMLTVN